MSNPLAPAFDAGKQRLQRSNRGLLSTQTELKQIGKLHAGPACSTACHFVRKVPGAHQPASTAICDARRFYSGPGPLEASSQLGRYRVRGDVQSTLLLHDSVAAGVGC